MAIRVWIAFVVVTLSVATSMKCTSYTCATSSHSLSKGNCAELVTDATVGDTVYMQKSNCKIGKFCYPYNLNDQNPTAQCTDINGPSPNASLVNEPCPTGKPENDCWKTDNLPPGVVFQPTCTNRKCTNFIAKNGSCSQTEQCGPNLYCEINSGETVGKCTDLIAIGTAVGNICKHDSECVMNAFCLGSSGLSTTKHCRQNYSLVTGDYCTADAQCTSGFCYDGNNNMSPVKHNGKGKCASVRPTTPDSDKVLSTCNADSECPMSTNFNDGSGEAILGHCTCVYMDSHQGVCQPFYGDKYFTPYFIMDKPFRSKPGEQTKCNTLHRNTSACYTIMNGSKKGASYAKAFAYAYYTINYVNLGTNPCVIKWFNSQYPAIIPGNKPIPPPPKPTPDDHDDDADDHDEHPNPHDDDDNPHPKLRPSGYDEDDSDDNAVTLILASLAFIL